MSLRYGIVGLPNVGKSTLFNALTASTIANVENYPFCTIEPNKGIASVPDRRLLRLAENAGSKKIVPAFIEFVDIAGLVKNASRGEGLGNKFLSYIREVDAIIHVLRCFEDQSIIHVYEKVDPIRDSEIVETELIIADLESINRRLMSNEKKLKSNDREIQEVIEILKLCKTVLEQGFPVRSIINKFNSKVISTLHLITSKPVLYVCNILEDDSSESYLLAIKQKAKNENINLVVISSKIEAEISTLSTEDEKEYFLKSFFLKESGLSKIIKEAYSLLNLESFFTIGPEEAHAWTFQSGTSALEAGRIIHSDFLRGFIKVEVINYADLLKIGNKLKAKELGKLRVEGKEYVIQDGDVLHFRFNL